jgi:hypothetical protein
MLRALRAARLASEQKPASPEISAGLRPVLALMASTSGTSAA